MKTFQDIYDETRGDTRDIELRLANAGLPVDAILASIKEETELGLAALALSGQPAEGLIGPTFCCGLLIGVEWERARVR